MGRFCSHFHTNSAADRLPSSIEATEVVMNESSEYSICISANYIISTHRSSQREIDSCTMLRRSRVSRMLTSAASYLLLLAFRTTVSGAYSFVAPPSQPCGSSLYFVDEAVTEPLQDVAMIDRTRLGTLIVPHVGIGTISWTSDSCKSS